MKYCVIGDESVSIDILSYFLCNNCSFSIRLLNSDDLAADFYEYAEDYFCSAECVIQYLVKEASKNRDIEKLDLWFFALLYLYRHSLELLLKANIFKIVKSNQDRQKIVVYVGHDLKKGYKKLLELLKIETTNNVNSKWLQDYLEDISSVDKKSDKFRYPIDYRLNVLFNREVRINILAIRANMNKAYIILREIYNTGSFSEYEYEPYPPKLIVEGGHYYQQSVVGYKFPKDSFYPYCFSYENVGEFLKEKILNCNKKELFIPMCYMYRNAVELRLKRMIIELSHIERTKALKILNRKKHSILGLWNSIVNELTPYSNSPDDDSFLNEIENYINVIHNIDLESDKFRYPCNKSLQIYFSEEIRLDVEKTSSFFVKLCNSLDALDSMLSAFKEYEEEMANYYGYH